LVAAVLIGAIGLVFLYFGFRLFQHQTDKVARELMLVSVIYITVLQLIYVLDKFI
jgi:protoheme IX farnesyltransferase